MSKSLYTVGHGKITLHFHRGQAKTWMSKKRFILMLAGTQGGKTSFGPWWLWREVKRRGSGDYLAVASSYDLFKLKMLPEMQDVLIDNLGIGKWWGGTNVIEIRDPEKGFIAKRSTDKMYARIILRSAGSPGGLESSTAKAAWLDEVGQDVWDVTIWEAVLRRLSLNLGRVLGTTTIYNSGWIRSEWYDLWEKGDPDYDVIQFESVSNPAFPRKEFERARKTMPDWRFKMFYLGLFSKPANLVYPDYDNTPGGGVVVEDFEIPMHWPIYIGVDFGGVNGATVYFAEDVDHPTDEGNVFYCYAEYLEGNVPIKTLVTRTIDRIGNRETYYLTGGAASEGDYRREWATHGLYISQPNFTSVEVGILATTGLLRTGRLKVFASLKGVRSEFQSYRRKIDKQGKILDIIENKNAFHRIDAIRYFSLLAGEGGPQIY